MIEQQTQIHKAGTMEKPTAYTDSSGNHPTANIRGLIPYVGVAKESIVINPHDAAAVGPMRRPLRSETTKHEDERCESQSGVGHARRGDTCAPGDTGKQ